MSILVLVEHNNHIMHPAMRNVLTAALVLKEQPIHFLIIGYQCQSVVEQVSTLAGVNLVLSLDDASHQHPLAEQLTAIILAIASSYNYILAPSSTFGKNCLPRIAAKLDVTQVSDVIRILNNNTFEHPIYAGNAIEEVQVLDEVKVLTIRSSAFNAVTDAQTPCTIDNIQSNYNVRNIQFINHQLNESKRPDLGSAKIVVSGGRGLQSAEKFKIIEELADVLGAAIGASRAAVDAGFVPNDYQVGQTGRVVAPSLYIAIGISGAIQHLAGMKDSKIIVAINKDADAPIFQIANYGLVGDLFDIVPEIIQKITDY